MRRNGLWLWLAALVACDVCAGEAFLREEFDTTNRWEELTFPKIKAHSSYEIIREGTNSVLKATTSASASGLILKESFLVAEYPVISWKWKIDGVIEKGDAATKEGDDYAARVYIIFEYDPKEASFGMRTKYGLAKRLYGQYPPHSSLNYIWANREHEADVIISPYTDRSRMIPLQQGPTNIGEWVIETVHVIRDYRKAFGEESPKRASLALMCDSDNTGGSATAYFDTITVKQDEELDKE